ncbi:MAG: DUF998 domain-containing protein [Fidelibacterota bacterium]|nr:MAG: DUF998 domain-containing protein [Candidatus Neomarinimicrobiota bacterium]
MKEGSGKQNNMVISYLTLRKAVGILGTALPFVLFLGALIIFRTGVQSSISAYYHTGMGDVYVGTLCVIGLFLFSYKGYPPHDNLAGHLGCVFAVGTALFPAAPECSPTNCELIIGYVHFSIAAFFFFTLIYFSIFLFTKTDPDKPATKQKGQRNIVYKVCGYIMIICILLVGLYHFLPANVTSPLKKFHPVFWLEAAAIVAFGISWLIKGETLLKDKA